MYEQLRGEPESRVDTGYTLSRIFESFLKK